MAFTGDIAAEHVVTDLVVQIGMTPFKLADKLGDRLDNDAKPCQRAHRRTKRRRIHALTARVNSESPHQPIRQTLE